jgi:hypothetical protein
MLMAGWLRFLMGKPKPKSERLLAVNDMRVTPVDNPLDVREDRSIRQGDPAYDFLMEAMNSDGVTVANQKNDGTWETKKL